MFYFFKLFLKLKTLVSLELIKFLIRYHSSKLYSTRKYIDQFSNGLTLFRTYLTKIKGSRFEWTPENIQELLDDVSLLFIFPRTSISGMFKDGILSAAEYAYAYGTLFSVSLFS